MVTEPIFKNSFFLHIRAEFSYNCRTFFYPKSPVTLIPAKEWRLWMTLWHSCFFFDKVLFQEHFFPFKKTLLLLTEITFHVRFTRFSCFSLLFQPMWPSLRSCPNTMQICSDFKDRILFAWKSWMRIFPLCFIQAFIETPSIFHKQRETVLFNRFK